MAASGTWIEPVERVRRRPRMTGREVWRSPEEARTRVRLSRSENRATLA
jgi:hypothetical protein